MPIRHAIWKVSAQPQLLAESALASEAMLEEMIVAAPRILSEEWLLIGRQERTSSGGIIDLLAIAPDGSLVLIELKRNKTPREVVAQALDYASWIEKLQPEAIAAIYGRFKPGCSLADDFKARFGSLLDEDSLNQSHQIIIVAASLDDSTERIVGYLSGRDIPINVLFFQVFSHGDEKFISRSWLLDPVHTQVSASIPTSTNSEPWNGEFYVSFGHGKSRSWSDATKFGFICAGGGSWYSKTLGLLSPGDRVWVKAPGYGFVGVGRVTGPVQHSDTFCVVTQEGEVSVLKAAKGGDYHIDCGDNPDTREYFVPVQWLDTLPIDRGVKGIGLFGNQNTVCKPTTPKWRSTVEYLKIKFPNFY